MYKNESSIYTTKEQTMNIQNDTYVTGWKKCAALQGLELETFRLQGECSYAELPDCLHVFYPWLWLNPTVTYTTASLKPILNYQDTSSRNIDRRSMRRRHAE